MFSIKPYAVGVVLTATLTLSGCAGSKGGDAYSRDEARRTLTVRTATVENVRAVTLEGSKSVVGASAGAIIGGIAGSSVANDTKGQGIGAVLGAVAGGLAGGVLEERATRESAVEITVRTEDGKLTAIVQAGDASEFKAGDRVRLLTSGSETRVAR